MSDALKMEVLDHVSQMYLNPEVSDVTLVVNDVEIPGHRSVLASRSSYLKELLFGQPWEVFKDTGKVPIEGVNDVEAFKAVLKFIYTGDVDLSDDVSFLIEMIRLARMYSLFTLEDTLKSHLKGLISIDNILKIYEVSRIFWYQDILAMCTDYIDNNAEAIMTHESFSLLSVDGLKFLLVRDSLKVREITIFLAVKNWLQENNTIADDTKKDILSNIKLSYISPTDLMNVIKPSRLFSLVDVVNAILKLLTSCEDLIWNEFRADGNPGLVKKLPKYEEPRKYEYYKHPRTKKEVMLTMDEKIIANDSTTTKQSVSSPPTKVTKQANLTPPPAKKTRFSLRKRRHDEDE